MSHILGWITDAKNRPEIKAVLGIICIAVAFGVSITWLIVKGDVGGALAIFGTFFGAGLTLLGITALADAKNDALQTSYGQDIQKVG